MCPKHQALTTLSPSRAHVFVLTVCCTRAFCAHNRLWSVGTCVALGRSIVQAFFSCTSLSSCRPRSPSVPVHTHTHVSPVYPYRVTCRSGYPSQASRYHLGASTSPLTLLSSPPPPPCCSCRLVWDARSSFTIDCDRLIIHRLPDVTHKPKPPSPTLVPKVLLEDPKSPECHISQITSPVYIVLSSAFAENWTILPPA